MAVPRSLRSGRPVLRARVCERPAFSHFRNAFLDSAFSTEFFAGREGWFSLDHFQPFRGLRGTRVFWAFRGRYHLHRLLDATHPFPFLIPEAGVFSAERTKSAFALDRDELWRRAHGD